MDSWGSTNATIRAYTILRPGEPPREFPFVEAAVRWLVEHPGAAKIIDPNGKLLVTRGTWPQV